MQRSQTCWDSNWSVLVIKIGRLRWHGCDERMDDADCVKCRYDGG